MGVGDGRSSALDALFLAPAELHGRGSEAEREHLALLQLQKSKAPAVSGCARKCRHAPVRSGHAAGLRS